MKKLFTEKEYQDAKYKDLLPCECYGCKSTFLTSKKLITQEIKHERGRIKYCSKKCLHTHKSTHKLVKCKNCKVKLKKVISQINKTKNNFCCKSCAGTYNSKHKTHGTRRSKLELYVEKILLKIYPNLNFHFNRKDTIQSELDIFIPSLSLAFELSGIFHYEPIYGKDKLLSIQNNDSLKIKNCIAKNITLITIDTRSQKRFTNSSSQVFIDKIVSTINDKIGGENSSRTNN